MTNEGEGVRQNAEVCDCGMRHRNSVGRVAMSGEYQYLPHDRVPYSSDRRGRAPSRCPRERLEMLPAMLRYTVRMPILPRRYESPGSLPAPTGGLPWGMEELVRNGIPVMKDYASVIEHMAARDKEPA